MTNQLIPRLRFKQFNNQWILKNIGAFTNSFSGGTPSISNPKFYNGNIPFIRSSEINSSYTKLFINNKALKSTSAKMVQKGNILYAIYGNGTSGKVGIAKISGAINQAIMCIDDKTHNTYNNHFLANWLASNRKHIRDKYVNLGGQKNLSTSIVNDIQLFIPSPFERQKIGFFFSKLNQLIDLQSQKLSHLKQLKKGYLQKMFPQKGESVPKLRFDGFRDKWNKNKLNDLVKESNLKESINPSENNLLSVKLHFKGIYPTKEHPRITKKGRKYYYRNSGELIIGKQNFQNGGFGIAKNNVNGLIASSAILSFDFLNNVNNEFLLSSMMRNNWLQMTTIYLNGTGQKEYGTNTLKNLQISVPSIQEQNRIGQFFKYLDQSITKQKNKLTQLKQLKKGYLQKMFI